MNKSIAMPLMAFLGTLLFFLISSLPVYAHSTHVYEINGVEYQIVVGSLGEPVIVDDKTGLDLRITRNGDPYVGAADELQVELIAGDVSRIKNIEAAYGEEGVYDTTFIATVPTTLQYRVFGELEGAAFDQTYTCTPAGDAQAEENTERRPISDGVVKTLSRGGFGCPQAKEAFGFPEEAASGYNLGNDIDTVSEQMASVPETVDEESGDPFGLIALVLSVIAVLLGGAALVRKPKTENFTSQE